MRHCKKCINTQAKRWYNMHYKKGKLHYSKKDTFSLDATLNTVISAGLIKFKKVIEERRCGVPSSILHELYGDDFYSNREYGFTDEQIQEGFKKWLETIDKMIYAFSNDDLNPDDKVKEGRDLFIKHYDSLWW